ncbi:hypothetical protein C0J52_02175 [Blattella germanica]|nr:hypothetical protein C0J52_02175 [Blattella germanica]
MQIATLVGPKFLNNGTKNSHHILKWKKKGVIHGNGQDSPNHLSHIIRLLDVTKIHSDCSDCCPSAVTITGNDRYIEGCGITYNSRAVISNIVTYLSWLATLNSVKSSSNHGDLFLKP